MARRYVVTVAVAAMAVAACGGGGESTGTTSDGAGGFITGAGGGPATGGAPPTTGTGAATTTSSSTGMGAAGGAGGMGTGGMGVGGGCVDIGLGEPNESETTAWALKMSSIDDCDDSGDSITGVIAPGDTDWFYYEGDDKTFCVVDPTRSLSQSQSGLRLCKYFECLNGNTEVDCPGGTTAETSGEGRPGCCGTSGFDVDLNCAGSLDEHAYVYIRLDQPGGDASTCNEYTLDYHY
jgi:hypothetical protein